MLAKEIMKTTVSGLCVAIVTLLVVHGFSGQTFAQSGGSVSPSAGPSRPAPKPSNPAPSTGPTKTTTPTRSPKTGSTTRKPAASLDRIDGKWWTVGNGFGDSEVILTQNGSSISGVINFADGRTGTIKGTFAGKRLQHTWSSSDGNGGTGWLELSYTNFLGGPWRNQYTRDGSWVLRRIEGKWCFGGSRSRIRTVTHNARGEMLVVTEDGSRDGGRLVGSSIYLDSEYGSIEGEMFYKGNRIDWSSGANWTWCGR
jgi:hypothetical protein